MACATQSFKFSTISPQSVSVWPIAMHRAGERVPGGAERHLQLRLSRLSQPRAKRNVCPRVCWCGVWQTSKAKPLAVRELQPLRDRTHVATAVRTTIQYQHHPGVCPCQFGACCAVALPDLPPKAGDGDEASSRPPSSKLKAQASALLCCLPSALPVPDPRNHRISTAVVCLLSATSPSTGNLLFTFLTARSLDSTAVSAALVTAASPRFLRTTALLEFQHFSATPAPPQRRRSGFSARPRCLPSIRRVAIALSLCAKAAPKCLTPVSPPSLRRSQDCDDKLQRPANAHHSIFRFL